ncbi:MAG: hypothetical protein BEN19_07055 [Epulopiscium sp. Nuni2H_MBin003]|nr:MAG: hypothetical protein BEN19_07055 [Epulopiscium sp. Nuni2H_MBin003]
MGYVICILWGLSTGIIISTGMVAFITAIGIIPRLLQRANIKTHFFAMGNAALIGNIFGSICILYEPSIPIGYVGDVIYGIFIGIFVGTLAAALTEIIGVFPVMKKRLCMKQGIRAFVLAFAIGKLAGALYYWLYPSFI